MSDEEHDPEVAADLALRAATQRDPMRSREMPKYTPPKFIGKVPCRARCGNVCDWTEEAEHAFATWNKLLGSRADAPLDKTRIVFCGACRARGVQLTAENNRKHVDKLAEKVRALKGSNFPDEERELIKQITEYGHPDVKGLLDAIAANKAKQQASGKTRRGTL